MVAIIIFSIIKLQSIMLDAEGYPKAYLKVDGFKIEFSEVHFKNGKLVGRFEIDYDE